MDSSTKGEGGRKKGRKEERKGEGEFQLSRRLSGRLGKNFFQAPTVSPNLIGLNSVYELPGRSHWDVSLHSSGH